MLHSSRVGPGDFTGGDKSKGWSDHVTLSETLLGDPLRCAKQRGIVCMMGMVGNKWSFDDFNLMEVIPTSVWPTRRLAGWAKTRWRPDDAKVSIARRTRLREGRWRKCCSLG